MAVVAKPELEKGFSGKVDLLRVSKDKTVEKTSYGQKFLDVVEENESIKNDWRR